MKESVIGVSVTENRHSHRQAGRVLMRHFAVTTYCVISEMLLSCLFMQRVTAAYYATSNMQISLIIRQIMDLKGDFFLSDVNPFYKRKVRKVWELRLRAF